ncbi:hypothetical protein WA026_005486 [Henosepilachna vigintioctopunctata]|uniref:Sorbin and SH3 domain-containing protein 1 n=1 Tax=Henosepilachna vigintioctopunctata TaxID=420089 RepID=A0AAW1U5L9_9CUCU
MPDCAKSKSKKRRSRKQKNKSKKSEGNVNNEPSLACSSHGETEDAVGVVYKVDFPETTVTSNPKVKVKSRSLDDDDDSLKIQEITEEASAERDAVISEAGSDWEEATDLRVPQTPISLSTVAISIDEEPLQRIEILSPEEELSLRNFLEDINLVSVAERSSTKSTLETIKSDKARKREALAKYFKPLVYNPRYLDIISEEGSDLSDKETPSLTLHLKQGTPELENIPKEPSPKAVRRRELRRLRLPQTKDRAVLVCTKVIETPSVIEHVHTHATENIEAETVFIESTSTSSKDSSDSEEVSWYENDEDEISEKTEQVSKHQEVPDDDKIQNDVDVATTITKTRFPELEIDVKNICETKQRGDDQSCTQTPNTESNIATKIKNVIPTYYGELTPPPTPDSSPKSKLPDVDNIDLNEYMTQISNDTAKEITSVLCKLTQACHSNVIVNQAIVIPPEKSINLISSRSPSRSSSSSRETSPSTVRVNQMNSSIADVRSIVADLELAKEASLLKQPLTLRQVCLNCLLSLPCGAEMLQELSDISFNLDKLTQALNQTQTMLASDASATKSNHESISDSRNTMWTGLPFQSSPNLLLCLSPTQKVHLDKTGVLSKEPEALFDLHAKFMNRADQNQLGNSSRDDIEMTSIRKVVIDTADEANNVNSFTLPRNFKPNTDNPRLQVSNLDEWLTIARNDKVNSPHETDAKFKNKFNTLPQSSSNDNNEFTRRRSSLPDDLCKRQMEYILEKEKEIEKELHDLLEEKRKLYLEMENYEKNNSLGSDKVERTRPKSFPTAPSETFRQKMYEEYMNQVAEREERKHKKVIKITSSPGNKSTENEKPIMEVTHLPEIEDEFMKKVQQLHGPLHKVEEEEESEESETFKSSEISEYESVIFMDGNSLKNVTSLPKHLREFVEITSECSKVENCPDSANGVWAPGQKQEFTSTDIKNHQRNENDNEAIPTIWRPKSATSSPSAERKEFRAVNYESPKLSRKNKSEEVLNNLDKSTTKPPWQSSIPGSDTGLQSSAGLEKQFSNSQLTPVAGYNDFTTSRLPKAQNPTITLLQKAREGQLPRGATYIEANRDHYNIPNDSGGQGETLRPRRSDFYSESDNESSRRMVDVSRRKINGVGPITKDGMPLSLRSEVKDSNQSKWYKKMYDTIHKQKPYRDEYVTVRYKQRRAQYPYITGYLSEPEPSAYDSDHMDYKYATLDRRRTPLSEKEQFSSSTMPRNTHLKTSSSFDAFQYNPGSKVNPGRIENYMPGHSSIQEQESKRWWDEVMDIFDGNFEDEKKPVTKGYMSQALRESGYESDSTLIFKRKEDGSQLSPSEQKEAYRIIQKGGDIPLHGLRRAAPERPKGSPKKYVENQVTIHYKTPVRQEIKDYYSEDELAHRQQEAIKKIYQEERRRKYLQELQDMHNRRHTDNFISSQKSPIALNRYDDFDDLVSTPQTKTRPRSPEPRLVARALYNFVGMTPRELTFRKGDNIYVRRQIDKNWYEGELNAMVGLFPVNYVEIIPYENVRTTPRKPHEGQARAKYNFLAKTHLELSLAKGEMVIITRRVDSNWYEGKIGGRRGIFPASYVDVLIDPHEAIKDNPKPIASPAAHSLLLNGTNARESMGSHTYTPNISNPESATTPKYFAKPVQASYNSYENRSSVSSKDPMSQALHIDTQSAEPTCYKALYKYLPQNDDELELMEGDKIYVLEKCDDGWFVGSNERTGAFGTFPGNYVDRP